MMTWRFWLALLSVLLAASLSHGAEPICDPQDPESCVVSIREGSPAPYTGVLLTPKRSAKITADLEAWPKRLQDAVGESREVAQKEIDRLTQLRNSDRVAYDQRVEIMRLGMEDYKARYAPQWYKHPALWYSLGVLTAVGIVVVSVDVLEARTFSGAK